MRDGEKGDLWGVVCILFFEALQQKALPKFGPKKAILNGLT